MQILLIRFDAALMSFGDVRVDSRGPTRDHPGLGQLTGLLGNALGYDHADHQKLARLQDRLRLASRCDRPGERQLDYQTVDLGQDFMREGWTTSGSPEGRKGGSASTGTHIRQRIYHAGRVQTLAIALDPPAESPTVAELGAALDAPARPLFLGRKPCLPAGRLNLGLIAADTLLTALQQAPRWRHRAQAAATSLTAWWPEDPAVTAPPASQLSAVVDERDWVGQVVVGRRLVRCGRIVVDEVAHV